MPEIQESIESKLSNGFELAHIEVANESDNHNVPANSETHFKVVLVAESFAGLSRVRRHQAVYALLAEELAGEVHALALHLYTAEEWQARFGAAPFSPPCLGGEVGGEVGGALATEKDKQ